MSTHFCRVGRIKPNLKKVISLKELENTLDYFVDDIKKIEIPKELSTQFGNISLN